MSPWTQPSFNDALRVLLAGAVVSLILAVINA